MGWVVNATPPPPYTQKSRPGTHCTWGWVGSKTGPETPALSSFRFPGGLQDRSPLVRKLLPSPVFDSRVGSKTGLHWSGNSRPHQFSIPGWAPRPVSTGPETLALTSFRSPDRPARSESLHQLRYPGPSTVRPRRTITYKANKARRNNALEYSDCCFVN